MYARDPSQQAESNYGNHWIMPSTQSSLYHSNLLNHHRPDSSSVQFIMENNGNSNARGTATPSTNNTVGVLSTGSNKTNSTSTGLLAGMMAAKTTSSGLAASSTISDPDPVSEHANINQSIVNDCPPSLKFLVKFYRWFGFSFNGLVFGDDQDCYNASNINNKSNSAFRMRHGLMTGHASSKIFNTGSNLASNHDWLDDGHHATAAYKKHISSSKSPIVESGPFWLRMQRYFYLTYNIVMFILFLQILATMIIDKYLDSSSGDGSVNGTANDTSVMNDNADMDVANSTSTAIMEAVKNVTMEPKWTSAIQRPLVAFINQWSEIFRPILNLQKNQADINQLKPILRAIIDSLLYVVLFDNLVSVFYLMIRGGRLVQLLMKIPNIELFDKSKRFAYQALGTMFGLSCVINTLGFISFNNDALQDLISSNSDRTFWQKAMTIFHLCIYIVMFFYLSVVPILFIYTMILFQFAINQLLNAFAAVNLDEIHMLKLKTKLSNLNDQFKEIIPYFALPLTVNFASNIFIIISSACFLMINSTRTVNQYMSFVFSLGLFAFLRLIVVACMGNLPTNICRDLIRTVYENLEQWSLNEWMCFMELKRLRKEFTVSIFSMYTVRQSSILAMLGFALNYIVILLQTENYSSNTTNPTENDTSTGTGSAFDNLTILESPAVNQTFKQSWFKAATNQIQLIDSVDQSWLFN